MKKYQDPDKTKNSENEDYSQELKSELSELVESMCIEEAMRSVSERLEFAFRELNPSDRHVLEQYFSGTSLAQIAKKENLAEEQISSWICQSKRKLIHALRNQCKVKN